MTTTWKLIYVPPAGLAWSKQVGTWTGLDAEERLTKALPMFRIEFEGDEARFYRKDLE